MLGSRRAGKVVATESKSIRGHNGLFGVHVPDGKFLEFLGISQDKHAFCFVFQFIGVGSRSRVAREEAAGAGGKIARYRRFGMVVEPSNLAKLAGFLQDHAAFGQEFIHFVLVRRIVGLGAHNRGVRIHNRFLLDSDGDRVGLIHRFRFRSILSTDSILLHAQNVERCICDLRCTRNGLRGSHVESWFGKGGVG